MTAEFICATERGGYGKECQLALCFNVWRNTLAFIVSVIKGPIDSM